MYNVLPRNKQIPPPLQAGWLIQIYKNLLFSWDISKKIASLNRSDSVNTLAKHSFTVLVSASALWSLWGATPYKWL